MPASCPSSARPRLLVLSSLFPHAGTPMAGLFVRERMFRVGRELPIMVVSPRPWFPGQGLLRRVKPGYRLPAPVHEKQSGVDVYFPRFLALPGIGRRFDSLMMALASWRCLRRLGVTASLDVIDAHFGYPDGHAATLLGRWLERPVVITLRGTEPGHAQVPALRRRLTQGLLAATRVFAVSDSLRRAALDLGVSPDKTRVVGNGVALETFCREDRAAARTRLGLPLKAPLLISVGGLVERKGFHRVIELLPALQKRHPGLRYLIIGGPSPEGDFGPQLRQQVSHLGLEDCVVFCGPQPPAELRWALSAADVFVLATRNEGWANVFLEAMACGLPVITTDVGGNREVVCDEELGCVVPFGDAEALCEAVDRALRIPWKREQIVAYAQDNAWETRVRVLVDEFRRIADHAPGPKGVTTAQRVPANF